MDPKPVKEIIESLFQSSSDKDNNNNNNERVLEIKNLIYGDIGRKIINRAASNSYIPITIDDFKDVNKTTIIRYFAVLENIGILKEVEDKNTKKFTITETGMNIAKTLT